MNTVHFDLQIIIGSKEGVALRYSPPFYNKLNIYFARSVHTQDF